MEGYARYQQQVLCHRLLEDGYKEPVLSAVTYI